MADFVAEPVTRTMPQPEELRAAAVRYLTRTGNADVLEVLGLAEEPEPAVGTKKPKRQKENAA